MKKLAALTLDAAQAFLQSATAAIRAAGKKRRDGKPRRLAKRSVMDASGKEKTFVHVLNTPA